MKQLLITLVIASLIENSVQFNCGNFNGLQEIGAGGYGKVYKKDKYAIKAVKDAEDCKGKAKTEYDTQNVIYTAFKQIPNNHKIANLARRWIKVAEPVKECAGDFTLNQQKYKCYFVMELLHGISLELYKKILPKKAIDDMIDSKLPNTKEIMGQFAMCGGTGQFFAHGDGKISATNPARGYFFSKDEFDDGESLDTLNKKYKLGLTLAQSNEILGYIWGFMFFQAQRAPYDVEVALGNYGTLNKPVWFLNVLDFGGAINIATRLKNNEAVNDIIDETGIDMTMVYADFEDDDFKKGWSAAAKAGLKRSKSQPKLSKETLNGLAKAEADLKVKQEKKCEELYQQKWAADTVVKKVSLATITKAFENDVAAIKVCIDYLKTKYNLGVRSGAHNQYYGDVYTYQSHGDASLDGNEGRRYSKKSAKTAKLELYNAYDQDYNPNHHTATVSDRYYRENASYNVYNPNYVFMIAMISVMFICVCGFCCIVSIICGFIAGKYHHHSRKDHAEANESEEEV